MTENEEFNNFEATVILRKAMNMNKVDLTDDPLYKNLQDAIWEKEMNKYGFIALGTTMNSLIFYSNVFRFRLPWVQVIGRMCGVTAFCTFFYWTSPGVRRYNQVLIEISKSRKKELLELFKPKTNSN